MQKLIKDLFSWVFIIDKHSEVLHFMLLFIGKITQKKMKLIKAILENDHEVLFQEMYKMNAPPEIEKEKIESLEENINEEPAEDHTEPSPEKKKESLN